MIIALAGASTVYADTPPPKAPAEKKAPEKTADKPADKKEQFSAEEAKKAEKIMDDFFDALVKNQDNCPKMATAIIAVLDPNEAWLTKLAESGKEPPPALKEKTKKRQGEVINAVMKCKDDKDVNAAFQRFAGIGMKKKAAEKTGTDKPSAPPTKK
jgi:hypothetical protein